MGLPPHIEWIQPFGVKLLDQRSLPEISTFVEYHDPEAVAQAIRDMVVRGAPAIGVTAAYGMVLAVLPGSDQSSATLRQDLKKAAKTLKQARPTAVNLSWAVDRMLGLGMDLLTAGADSEGLFESMRDEALRLHQEDIDSCMAIGRNGAAFVGDRARILTHCNAGALATGGYGTALGVIRAAVEMNKEISVLADETRPFLQGARLTAWELRQDGIPVTLICDSMAGFLMARGEVDLVVVGADRIARNGDTANKIGTYTVAVLAKRHGIPFYVAAPLSTFDASLSTGEEIPIEERDPQEVTGWQGVSWSPEGIGVRNIAFDVTPAELIEAIVTDHGVVQPVEEGEIVSLLNRAGALY